MAHLGSGGNEQRARELMAAGLKKEQSWSLFNSSKYEEAAEFYIKAANLFKLAKLATQCGEAFQKAAECHRQQGNRHEVATNYINAANAIRKTEPAKSLAFLQQATAIYCEDGRFAMAAKYEKEAAQICETDDQLELAIEHYQRAADYFEGENSPSSANQCLLKIAEFSAQLEKYNRSVEVYEQVAASSIDNTLLKWSVKDYLFRAGLCRLCTGDVVSCQRALERYQQLDASFSASRECKFLNDLINSLDSFNLDQLNNAIADYDSISKLDNWKSMLLLRIKSNIKQEAQQSNLI
eukprot:TRINITY_DN1269_c3_g1_i1.p1 TRINITY_DN1269_c3_g1~~TRINITY_DN1269_c3_g1_i1.p1  ORF type:complete len:295 (-),score=158.40 TRINITY_DN1269_c3_g1_i1:126-1010(-)